jgi:hypothetical protein
MCPSETTHGLLHRLAISLDPAALGSTSFHLSFECRILVRDSEQSQSSHRAVSVLTALVLVVFTTIILAGLDEDPDAVLADGRTITSSAAYLFLAALDADRLRKREREQESQSGDASRDAGATCSSATACRVTTTSARWSTVINIAWSSCSCRLIPRTSRSRLDDTLYASFKNVIAQEFNTAQVTAHLQKGGTNAKSLVLVPRRTSSRRPRQPSAKRQG